MGYVSFVFIGNDINKDWICYELGRFMIILFVGFLNVFLYR